MLSSFFHNFLYIPIYNLLIFFIDLAPNHDVGIAVILVTIVVRIILFPLSKRSVEAQFKIRELDPVLKKIKRTISDKQEQARKMMEVYKENNINPLASVFLILIQFPIIIALYFVFFRGGLPEINPDLLYSFVSEPDAVNMFLLGFIDISKRSVALALLVGITQYMQSKITLPPPGPRSEKATLQDDLARSFQLQIRYVLPIVAMLFSYFISAVIALYWLTSNVFTIGQEYFLRRNRKN